MKGKLACTCQGFKPLAMRAFSGRHQPQMTYLIGSWVGELGSSSSQKKPGGEVCVRGAEYLSTRNHKGFQAETISGPDKNQLGRVAKDTLLLPQSLISATRECSFSLVSSPRQPCRCHQMEALLLREARGAECHVMCLFCSRKEMESQRMSEAVSQSQRWRCAETWLFRKPKCLSQEAPLDPQTFSFQGQMPLRLGLQASCGYALICLGSRITGLQLAHRADVHLTAKPKVSC